MTARYAYVLPFTAQHKVIEFGGGDKPVFRPNVDVRRLSTVDYVMDLNGPMSELGTITGQFDGVFSQYVLEHVSWRKVRYLLKAMRLMLQPGGRLVLIVPNLVEQARYIMAKDAAGEFGDNEACCIFGDQNYEGQDWRANAHSAGWSPSFLQSMLIEAGFGDVMILPHPETDTDMIVEATAVASDGSRPTAQSEVDNWSPEQRRKAYGHDYFNGGGTHGGYAREGYWDYPVHRLTAQHIMKLKPTSVLEIGPARGYVLKQLEDNGIRVAGLEVSRHCVATRVIKNIIEFDITAGRWPFADGEFDLCFSNAVLEHIPEKHVAHVAAEMARVSRRGLHGISFKDDDDGFDRTHCTLRSQDWWAQRLPATQQVVDKEELERGPIPPSPDDGKLKINLGSYTVMFPYGWINIDTLDLSGFAQRHNFAFQHRDLSADLALSPTNSVDLIFSSHMLEHLTLQEGVKLLKHCHEIMKPGAIMRVVLPDAKKLAELYRDGKLAEVMEPLLPQKLTQAERLPANLLWMTLAANHKCTYDHELLKEVVMSAGFSQYAVRAFRESASQKMLRETQESLPDISLYAEFTK